MNFLDMRTVVFSYAISNAICAIVVAFVWAHNRRRFAGLGFWLADLILQVAALALAALRGIAPDFLTMTVSDALVIGGTLLLYIGLERFTGQRGPQFHNYILLGVFLLTDSFFVYLVPNQPARNILISLGWLAICSQCAWLMLRQVPVALSNLTQGVGYISIVFCLVSMLRIFIEIAAPPGNDFFDSTVYETGLVLTYQMLFVILTFSLTLMVNRRLSAGLESDIATRQQAEAARLVSEEKFFQASSSGPEAFDFNRLRESHLAERIIQARLQLWEYSANHSVSELMQKALDEIEDLTGSMIGFYHFVEQDQNGLSLQAWSTRTLEVFCKAQGKGMHYPISEAGVWVDCVHQRKPVIHNDYAALAHRKGLPEGHAAVIREAVVPILRDGRVVSILGVGNKPTEYDEHDVELVAYIADLVWEIVEYKQADEQIRQLNTQLEHLAMTDELTGLTNRRSFYIQGAKEIKRSQRYQTPFSLLMLDLDEFKTVNDRYGHEAGDKMLQSTANILLENIRETDLLARLGGEEFSVMMPNADIQDAVKLAERLRLAVAGASCSFYEHQMKVTVSIGAVSFHAGITHFDDLLRNADTAMYQAKNQGRNRVVVLE